MNLRLIAPLQTDFNLVEQLANIMNDTPDRSDASMRGCRNPAVYYKNAQKMLVTAITSVLDGGTDSIAQKDVVAALRAFNPSGPNTLDLMSPAVFITTLVTNLPVLATSGRAVLFDPGILYWFYSGLEPLTKNAFGSDLVFTIDGAAATPQSMALLVDFYKTFFYLGYPFFLAANGVEAPQFNQFPLVATAEMVFSPSFELLGLEESYISRVKPNSNV